MNDFLFIAHQNRIHKTVSHGFAYRRQHIFILSNGNRHGHFRQRSRFFK
jgi:hypothetical protein